MRLASRLARASHTLLPLRGAAAASPLLCPGAAFGRPSVPRCFSSSAMGGGGGADGGSEPPPRKHPWQAEEERLQPPRNPHQVAAKHPDELAAGFFGGRPESDGGATQKSDRSFSTNIDGEGDVAAAAGEAAPDGVDLAASSAARREAAVDAAVGQFDADGDGVVSPEELREGLARVQDQQQQLMEVAAKLAEVQNEQPEREAAALREANAAAITKLLQRLGDSQGYADYMDRAEYLEMCAEFGVDTAQADELEEALEAAGQLVRCEGTPFAGKIFLRPDALCARLAAAAVRPPGASPVVAASRAVLAASRLQRLEAQLGNLSAHKVLLDRYGQNTVSRRMTFGLGGQFHI